MSAGRRVPSSLTARLVLAFAGVALVSALLSGVLVAPLVSSAAEDAVREPLSRQADFFARLPDVARSSGRFGALTGRSGLEVGGVTDDGAASGVADALTETEVAALLDGRPVSTRATYDGTDMLVEARPSRSGGAVVLATDADVVGDATSTLRRRVLLAIAIGLVGALGIAWLLAARLGSPLRRAAQAARRLAAGERGVDLPSTGVAEVAEVTAALGALDTALATSEGRQREFLLSVSHELRTPMTAVRGYAEALADGVVPADETADVARTMVAETDRLERYVADLLALARLQADDFALQVEPVDVAALLEAARAAWDERASRAGVVVSVVVEGASYVETDGMRLRQVVDALVDNAVRVCASGDRVVLATYAGQAGVVVEVRDSGPGLTADDATVAFEPGVLHDRYAGRRPGGQGLGLAIVHRLVTRLGGSVVVDHAPEGGARFTITLPGPPKSR